MIWRRILPLLAGLLALLATASAADSASPADLLSVGRVDDAIRLLKDRLQAAPSDAQAYNLLTRTYFYMGRWDEAAAAAERAVALAPASSDYQLWLGRAAGERAAHASFVTAVRMVPRIRGSFERAVQLDGSNAEARTDLAEFYMEAPAFLGGGKDKALAQAAALDTQDAAAAHWVRAQLAQREKKFDLAEQEYRAAIAASREPGNRWLDLAGFYFTRGRIEQMEDSISQAASQDTARSTVPYEAALLLLEAGRNFPRAIELLQKYLASGSQPDAAPAYKAHFVLGVILEKQGNTQAAAAEYRTALAMASQFADARAALQRLAH